MKIIVKEVIATIKRVEGRPQAFMDEGTETVVGEEPIPSEDANLNVLELSKKIGDENQKAIDIARATLYPAERERVVKITRKVLA